MQKPAAFRGPEWTILKVLKWTTSYFKSHDIESPRSAAEILLAHVLKLKRIELYVHYDQPLTRGELEQFKAFIKRRIQREPVAYILGTRGFWTIDVRVSKDVLIPRPETECLVEEALSRLTQDRSSVVKRVLELGTGSGAIILALALQRPQNIFFASDNSMNAVQIAAENVRDHGLQGRIHFFCGDWLDPTRPDAEPFSMILSNPPYIRKDEISRLQPEIYQYEPLTALDGGPDGLDCLKRIITTAHNILTPGGNLLLEIGYDQRPAVQEIIDSTSRYENVQFLKDYSGHNRVVGMRKRN